jgi:hypothetical protein
MNRWGIAFAAVSFTAGIVEVPAMWRAAKAGPEDDLQDIFPLLPAGRGPSPDLVALVLFAMCVLSASRLFAAFFFKNKPLLLLAFAMELTAGVYFTWQYLHQGDNGKDGARLRALAESSTILVIMLLQFLFGEERSRSVRGNQV